MKKPGQGRMYMYATYDVFEYIQEQGVFVVIRSCNVLTSGTCSRNIKRNITRALNAELEASFRSMADSGKVLQGQRISVG